MSSVNKDVIKKVAELAKLSFSESEFESIALEFNQIIDYVSLIQSVDVSDIKDEHNLDNYKDTVMQGDDVLDYKISSASLLMNATEGREKNGYIVVRGKNVLSE